MQINKEMCLSLSVKDAWVDVRARRLISDAFVVLMRSGEGCRRLCAGPQWQAAYTTWGMIADCHDAGTELPSWGSRHPFRDDVDIAPHIGVDPWRRGGQGAAA